MKPAQPAVKPEDMTPEDLKRFVQECLRSARSAVNEPLRKWYEATSRPGPDVRLS